MSPHKENFNFWFRDIIQSLYKNENAGFAILMLTFPLLERYLRSKSSITYDKNLSDDAHRELMGLFPALNTIKDAREFWTVYRHGILHQATFSPYNIKGHNMPDGWLSGNTEAIEIHSNGAFWVNPVKFAEHVINTINKEFLIFEALGVAGIHQLASVRTNADGFYETSGIAYRNIHHK